MLFKPILKRNIRRLLSKLGVTSRPSPFHFSNLRNFKYYFLSRRRDPDLAKAEVGCIMCTWMEDFMVPLALESSKDFVNRYVIVDKGEGKTVEVIKACRDKWDLDIEIHVKPEMNLRESRFFALKRIDEPWVMNQDGDMVFHTDGPLAISTLRRFMDRPHIVLTSPMNNLIGDLRHTIRRRERAAPHPFLYHNNGTVRLPDHRSRDMLIMDGWMIRLGKPYIFNCLLKFCGL